MWLPERLRLTVNLPNFFYGNEAQKLRICNYKVNKPCSVFELRSCVRTVVIEYKTEPLVNGKSKFFFFLFLDYGFVLTCFKHSSLVNYLNRKRIKYNFVCGITPWQGLMRTEGPAGV